MEQGKTLDEKVDGLVHTVADLVFAVKGNTEAIASLTKKTHENTTTIDDLARMTKEGFDAVGKNFATLENNFATLEKDVDKLKSDVAKGFQETKERLDRIELLLLTDHRKRIERLEDEVKELMTAR